MLLKQENEIEDERQFDTAPSKKVDLESTEANVNMGDIVDESKVPFNPFIEPEKPEVMDFLTPNTTQESNTSSNSIINEFREMKAENNNVESQPKTNNNLTTAINTSRETIDKLRNLGLNVESEEFDFEDMYQIIIKIKKD